jgi:hypothetical protein
MDNKVFITKEQLINEMGLSKSTFYRMVKKKDIELSSGLLSPCEQQELKRQLGCLPDRETDDLQDDREIGLAPNGYPTY